MSSSNAFEPGERDANASGDATAEVLPKMQGNREADIGEPDDGNVGLGVFGHCIEQKSVGFHLKSRRTVGDGHYTRLDI